MTKRKLAIVGCGDIAGFTARLSRLVPQVTISACCETNEQKAQAFAKQHRIPHSSMVAASEQAVTIEVYGEKGTAKYQGLPFPSIRFIGVKVRKERPPEWGVHALQRSLTGFANWVLHDKRRRSSFRPADTP